MKNVETQQIEYKASWRDEYIKWICGFVTTNFVSKSKKLFAKHPSAPYNPLISQVFFLYGLIEAWGTGILKMLRECRQYGTRPPNFTTDFTGFFIEFNDTNSDTNDDTNDDTNILNLIKNKPDITVVTLARKVKKSRITILRQIEKLKDEKLIVRVGNNKLGYWRVTKKGNNI